MTFTPHKMELGKVFRPNLSIIKRSIIAGIRPNKS